MNGTLTRWANRIWTWYSERGTLVKVLIWLVFYWGLIPILAWKNERAPSPIKWGSSVLGGFLLLVGMALGSTPPPTDGPAQHVATESPSPAVFAAPTESPAEDLVMVSKVIDGDTIEVDFNGTTETVRLIGVDTPETVHPTKPVGCYGPEASDFTTRTLIGLPVRLELDVEQRDRYGRLLAYVFLDGELFNETLIRKGFGVVSTYPPNVKYVDLFTSAQDAAQAEGAGLWTHCAAPSPTVTGPAPSEECDPSYPGVCIPPLSAKGDLDCGDLDYTNFVVLPPDPHGFDRDGDGRGCTG